QERAWSMRLRACAREGTPRASSASKAGVRSMAGSHIQAKMVAGSPSFIGPASRSSRASGTVATPSTAAPWSTAGCAMRSAPWLYPSAFTTAMSWAGATKSAKKRVLLASDPRSTTSWMSSPRPVLSFGVWVMALRLVPVGVFVRVPECDGDHGVDVLHDVGCRNRSKALRRLRSVKCRHRVHRHRAKDAVQHRGLLGRGDHSAGDPCEHVPGARGGGPGVAGVHAPGDIAIGDDGVPTFEQHHRLGLLGQPRARGAAAVEVLVDGRGLGLLLIA